MIRGRTDFFRSLVPLATIQKAITRVTNVSHCNDATLRACKIDPREIVEKLLVHRQIVRVAQRRCDRSAGLARTVKIRRNAYPESVN